MFERYTEKARRSIFFSRYEASQFGSSYTETEHLLLGLLREEHALANRLFRSHPAAEWTRRQIDDHSTRREKVSTSVDLPLSHECKCVLAYAAEESKRLSHKHIDTSHLLLGLLLEEACFAAQLLREQGLTVSLVRALVQQADHQAAQGGSAPFARLDQWLTERQASGGIRIVKKTVVANRITHIAIYAVDEPKENENGQEITPAEKLAQIQKRIDSLVGEMERAIANHEFENARFYSDEERKERKNLSALREQFNLEEPPPLLCIEDIRDERFSEVQKRCDDYIAEGVNQIWLLDPDFKRAYTVTKTEGLREFKGGILQIANPPLEMDLSRIFD
jgi:ATP-dependent Clp protease ATP-binding subunit ClpA